MNASYDPHLAVAGGLPAEVERLERQAELAWADERPALARFGLDRAARVVELGCGTGAITRRLRDWSGASVLAVDRDPALLAHVPRDFVRLCADAAALPLPDRCADAVLLRYVLQHLAAPAPVLAEARRVLRPGGVVVVVDVDAELWGAAEPALPGLEAVYRKVAEAQRRRGGDRLVVRRAPRLLAEAGFVHVRVQPFATTSDARPVACFAVHAGPERLLPLVHSGDLTLADYAAVTRAWQQFCDDSAAWVMVLGFAVGALAPG